MALPALPAFSAAVALAMAAASLNAGEVASVEWRQLPDPSAQQFEDPYRDLTSEQMSDLMSLVRLREERGGDSLSVEQRAKLETRATELEAQLEAAGIDVDWLLSQRWVVAERRRKAAVAVNSALDGQRVELAGFLVPAPPMDSGATTTAYLLPDRRVCNHLPPSPPNQLVRLEMTSMPDLGGFCAPVVVRGTLRAQEARHQAFVIDDAVPMWSAWTITTDSVRYDQ